MIFFLLSRFRPRYDFDDDQDFKKTEKRRRNLKKSRAIFFQPETIIASFLHVMVLFYKVIFIQTEKSLKILRRELAVDQ